MNPSFFARSIPFPRTAMAVSAQSASAWADANFCSEPAFEQTIPTTPPAQNHHDMVIWPKYEHSQSWSEWGSSDAKSGFVGNWSKCKRTNIIESLDIDWPTNINSSLLKVFLNPEWKEKSRHWATFEFSYKYNPAFGIIVQGFDLVPITFPSSRIRSNREHVFDQPPSSVQWRGSHKSAAEQSRMADPAHIVQRGQNQGPKVQTVHPWWNIGISWRFHQIIQHGMNCKSLISIFNSDSLYYADYDSNARRILRCEFAVCQSCGSFSV